MGKRYFDNSQLSERIKIADGKMLGVEPEYKFGAVPEMSVSTSGSIWDINDTFYPWASLDSDGPGVIAIDRANSSDANKNVTVFGLDSDYNPIQDTVTLTNPTDNLSSIGFSRVWRGWVSDGDNIGDITIKREGTPVARILAGNSQTLMAVYTIPAGKTGFLVKCHFTAASGADASGHVFVRVPGSGAFRNKHTCEFAVGTSPYEWAIPLPIPEKSDIDFRADARTNNGRYTATYELILL